MIETRIYFSYNSKQELTKAIEYIDKVLDGYTLYNGNGYWKGINEPSVIIEIIRDKIDLTDFIVRKIAKSIKEICKQESVLITTKPIFSEFI